MAASRCPAISICRRAATRKASSSAPCRDLSTLLNGMRAAGEAPIAARPLAAIAPIMPPAARWWSIRSAMERLSASVIRSAGRDRSIRCTPAAERGFIAWSRTPVVARAAACSARLSDLLEAERDGLVSLLAREGSRSLNDGVAEVREAVDFCRYYAARTSTGSSPRTRSCPARPAKTRPASPPAGTASSSASHRGTFRWRSSSAG